MLNKIKDWLFPPIPPVHVLIERTSGEVIFEEDFHPGSSMTLTVPDEYPVAQKVVKP